MIIKHNSNLERRKEIEKRLYNLRQAYTKVLMNYFVWTDKRDKLVNELFDMNFTCNNCVQNREGLCGMASKEITHVKMPCEYYEFDGYYESDFQLF